MPTPESSNKNVTITGSSERVTLEEHLAHDRTFSRNEDELRYLAAPKAWWKRKLERILNIDWSR